MLIKLQRTVLSLVACAALMTAIESLGLASTSGMYQPKAPAGLDEYKLTRETYIQKLMSLFSKRG